MTKAVTLTARRPISSVKGQPTVPADMTDALKPFRRHLEGKGLADTTVSEYAKWVDRAARWLDDNLDVAMASADPWQVRRWVEDDVPDTWSSRKMARVSLDHWGDHVGSDVDLAGAVPVPRKPRPRPKPLGRGDAQKVEQAAFSLVDNDDYLRRGAVATLLGLYLGMRRAEIARASWECDGGDEWVFKRAKTGDVVALPVHPRLRAALDRYCSPSAWLFVGRHGRGHVSPSTVWSWVRDIAAKADVKATCHQLRHEAITRVVEAEGIRVGQEYAGHRDPEVTAMYAGVRQEQLEDAVASLDWAS